MNKDMERIGKVSMMDDEYDDEYDDNFETECGLMPDGQCSLAGTEHCDWDCGALNEQRIADMKSTGHDKETSK